jgi:hypothetical protein
MGLTSIRREHVRPEDFASGQAAHVLNRLQTTIDDTLRPLVQNPMLDGVLLPDVALVVAGTAVSHGLGRPWRGYIVTRRGVHETVATGVSVDDSRVIVLTASAPVTVDLWVF